MSSFQTIREGLEAGQQALTDWVRTYAPEFCDGTAVEEARRRIEAVGTLAYIAEANEKVRRALQALQHAEASISHTGADR